MARCCAAVEKLLALTALLVAICSAASVAPDATPPKSHFLSLGIVGDCEAVVREIHPLLTPPPHAWYPLAEPLSAVKLSDLDAAMPVERGAMTPKGAWRFRYLVVANLDEGTSTAHPFLDPRVIRLHGDRHEQDSDDDDERGHHHATPDGEFVLPDAAEHIWLPGNARTFDVYCQNTTSKLRFSVPQGLAPTRRHFSRLADDPSIEVRTEQMAGPPSTQINIIFLAGGFTLAEKEKFWKNVTDLTKMMGDPGMNKLDPDEDPPGPMANMRKSVPFNRYWSFFNVYGVFQASAESGASRPKLGITINNNLRCQHPAGIERAPFCDRDLAVALADVTPAEAKSNPTRSVIITIINTPIYGGTGMYIPGKLHLGNFFNGFNLDVPFEKQKMLSLMDHELGHAFGNLADEYDMGFEEPSDMTLSNCQIGEGGGNPPSSPRWQHWIDLFSATTPANFLATHGGGIVPDTRTPWGMLAVPAPICGFTNYFRPAAHCMMAVLTEPFMCPVCREAATVTVMKSKFLYSWPRFPLEDPVTIVPVSEPPQGSHPHRILSANSTLILHLPVQLSGADFVVEWKDFDNTTIPPDPKRECPVCVAITPAMFSRYPLNTIVEIRAYITDNTVFLSNHPPVREAVGDQLRQVAVFKIRVSNDVEALTNVTLEEGRLRKAVGEHEMDMQMIYTMCPPMAGNRTPVCSLNFTNRRYSAPPPLDDLSQYDEWVFVVMGGVALVFLLLWIFAANKYGERSNGVVRPIFQSEFSCFASIIRKIMIFSAVVFMLTSLAAMGAATYFYTQMSAIGRYLIIAGVTLAAGLYVLAFVGFWAVSSRSKRMLLLNGFLLLIALAVLAAVGILIDQIGTQIKENDSEWTLRLQGWWRDLVADAPERACAIQQWLRCSGFIAACTNVVGSSLYCPRDCDEVNFRFASPCREVIQSYINDNYDTIIMIVGVCGGLVFGGIVLNMVLFCVLLSMKRALKKRVEQRVTKTASMHCGSSKPRDTHRALFLLKSLDAHDSRRLMREFKRIDIDGNGELDRKELFIFFKKALAYRASMAEIEEIFKIADVNGDGTISAGEFLSLFGHDESLADQMEVPLKSQESKRVMRERLAASGFPAGAGGVRAAPAPNGGGGGALHVPRQQFAQQKMMEDIL